MRVVDLYKVLDTAVLLVIVDNENGCIIKAGNPNSIPVGILNAMIVSIESTPANSIYDIIVKIDAIEM